MALEETETGQYTHLPEFKIRGKFSLPGQGRNTEGGVYTPPRQWKRTSLQRINTRVDNLATERQNKIIILTLSAPEVSLPTIPVKLARMVEVVIFDQML